MFIEKVVNKMTLGFTFNIKEWHKFYKYNDHEN